jgi:hypothetical protein
MIFGKDSSQSFRQRDLVVVVVAAGALLVRREQRVNESIPDNRDRDHDINAQQNQQGQNPPAQLTARERAHFRGCELIWLKRADQRGIVWH